MNKLIDAQLEAIYKLIHQDSHTEALRAIYEAGCDWGQANPPVTVLEVPALSDRLTSPAQMASGQ